MTRVPPETSCRDETTASQPRFPLFNAMNFRLCTGLAALVCLSLASCVPYNEEQAKKKAQKTAEKTEPTADELKKKEAEMKKKKEEDALKKKEETTSTTTTTPENPGSTDQPKEEPKVEQKRTDYAFANKVPGKEGFVFSPYNNKVVDVRDIPSGTLVQDPTYPAAEKKYFRVP